MPIISYTRIMLEKVALDLFSVQIDKTWACDQIIASERTADVSCQQ